MTRNDLLNLAITLQDAARKAKAMQADTLTDANYDFYCGVRNGLGLAMREVNLLLERTY